MLNGIKHAKEWIADFEREQAMTDKLYTQSDLEALRERCAKVAEKWGNDLDLAGAQFDKDGDIYAQAGIAFTITRDIRALPITPHTEEAFHCPNTNRGLNFCEVKTHPRHGGGAFQSCSVLNCPLMAVASSTTHTEEGTK